MNRCGEIDREANPKRVKKWQSFKFARLEILVSRDPKAFFVTQIECPLVIFISALGIQLKLCNFTSWLVPFKL